MRRTVLILIRPVITGRIFNNLVVSQKGGGIDHEQEDIEVLELPFDKAYSMIGIGEIKDAKTIMLLQYAKIHSLL